MGRKVDFAGKNGFKWRLFYVFSFTKCCCFRSCLFSLVFVIFCVFVRLYVVIGLCFLSLRRNMMIYMHSLVVSLSFCV